ncbi:MAG: adenylyltransferase/cytidyltransferase family protein [Patescibacteria group bacterium]
MPISLKKKKSVVVAVSGGFDPVHVGHVRMFSAARALGDRLVVILNNDNWLRKKKRHVFMPEKERQEVLASFRAVDAVILTSHGENPEDMSVAKELARLKPDIFANGGDRFADNVPEVAVCKRMGCKMIFRVGRGGKVQSSSWLLNNYATAAGYTNEDQVKIRTA